MPAPYRRLARYRLIARLGSGGMADVYLALLGHPGGVIKVQVLKVLRPDLTDQERPEFLRMFEDEGRLAVRLNHPNIVQSHEVGSEDGHHFIAMEYLDGQPFNRVEERADAPELGFPLEMRLYVLSQVLEGLEYAHGLKDYGGLPLHIVHRDISPQNVFVTYSGQTKLVDFGIAKTLESSKTRAGVVKGKVPYMAPEQVLSQSVDHRTDLFSVGVMLWEAIACRPMYGTQSIYEIMRRLVQGSTPKIREVVPDVPETLEAIVNRALLPKPEDRYPDAATFHRDLSAYLDGMKRISARDVGEHVAQLFVEERREINDVIRRAMTEATEPSLAPLNLQAFDVIPTVRSSSTSSRSFGSANSVHTQPPTTMPVEHNNSAAVNLGTSQGSGAVPAAGKKWRTVGSAALGIVAAAVALTALIRSGRAPQTDGPVAATESSGITAPSPNPSVHLSIRATPSEARLSLDGKELESNPYQSNLPRDDISHTLDVTAPGFNPSSMKVQLDRDIDIQLSLTELEPAALAASEASSTSDAARTPQFVTGGRPLQPARPAVAVVKSGSDFRAFPVPHPNKAVVPKAERKFIEPWGSK